MKTSVLQLEKYGIRFKTTDQIKTVFLLSVNKTRMTKYCHLELSFFQIFSLLNSFSADKIIMVSNGKTEGLCNYAKLFYASQII